tara:strand:+ start:26689 stop:27225 length:537 start_codon:yes stop_codon:yes gene_type:complete
MMRWIAPVAALVLAGLLGFTLVLRWIPGFVMTRAMAQIEGNGAPLNTAMHVPPVTEESHNVVRPSPDIMYSICLFDLTGGPLMVQSRWPGGGAYASISLFDAQTNNFLTVSDSSQPGRTVLWVQGPDSEAAAAPDGVTAVRSPTTRGVVLYRRILDASASLASADAERQSFLCTPQPE